MVTETITDRTQFKKIAKIEYTHLGFEDHGIFTAIIGVDYGGSGQGIGMHMLSYNPQGKGHKGSPAGIDYLIKILGACGVDTWEKVKGRTIFVYTETDTYNSRIIGIGPLPTEGGKDFFFEDVKLWPDKE